MADDTLPPLPAIDHDAGWHRQYTAAQMHAYARAATAKRDAENASLRAEVAALREALTTIYHQTNGAHPSEWGLCVAAVESRARAALDANRAAVE